MKKAYWSILLSILPSISALSQTMTVGTVTPDSAIQGQTLAVAVAGQYTDFAQGSTSSWLERDGVRILPTSQTVQNDSLIDCVYSIPPNAAVGYWDVIVTDWRWGFIGLGSGMFIDAFIGVNPSGPAIRKSIDVFPNPAVNHFQIRYSLPNHSQVRIVVRDMRGHLIQPLMEGVQMAGEHEFRVEVADLQKVNGMFLVCLQVDEMEFAVKMTAVR